jgi:hypothetical protein
MLLVIFGAGASFDSADRLRLFQSGGLQPPPLAKELVGGRFNSIAASLPNSLPVIDRLRRRMGTDPTAGLESELARLSVFPTPFGPSSATAARSGISSESSSSTIRRRYASPLDTTGSLPKRQDETAHIVTL